jgi:hypothetical protein
MSDLVFAIANEARRVGLVVALRSRPALTVDQLVHEGKYAEDFAKLTVGELRGAKLPTFAALEMQRGESIEDAVMRVFERRQSMWLSSSFFIRHLGIQRWTAQNVLGSLAERGLLERRGTTSGTRYRLVHPHRFESCFGRTCQSCSLFKEIADVEFMEREGEQERVHANQS